MGQGSPRPVVAVAFSGGRDSTALLHATARAAQAIGVRVVALHVHHGLSPSADAWLAHGAELCARWTRETLPVEFFSTRLTDAPERGDSVEAWARRARYGALRRMAIEQGAELVLLAHHRRDQAETFLLQALRAGSAASLSSMPASATRDGLTWARPWLAMPDSAIDAYVSTHRLPHVDDDSDSDTRLARNRLRAKVWPALLGAFPHAEAALAAAATLAQAAATTMQEWAAVDLAAVGVDDGLDIAAWRSLPPARRANVLHAWLRDGPEGDAVRRSLVERLEGELDVGKSRRWPLGNHTLYSYRGALRSVPAGRRMPECTGPDATAEHGFPSPIHLDLHTIGVHAVPAWRGAFVVDVDAGVGAGAGGVPSTLAAALVARRRLPYDTFQAGPGRPARRLKLQFQAAAVPSWLRDGPVLTDGRRVVYVPGLGIDARVLSEAGGPSLRIAWHPD